QDTCETCSVQIDKQIKCGAGPFIDVGFVSNNEDGTASCLGWNAFTIDGANVPAESLTVQYTAKNTGGTALFSCTVTDTNTVISSTTVPIADTIVVSGTSNPVPINTTCSAELSASEPDTATVSCFCTADKNANFLATAKDMAKFQCLTPGLNVTKTCLVPDASGNSEVDIELMNTGTADLANCVVSDNVFKNDPTCPPTGASTPVTVPGVASLPHGMSTTVKGSGSGRGDAGSDDAGDHRVARSGGDGIGDGECQRPHGQCVRRGIGHVRCRGCDRTDRDRDGCPGLPSGAAAERVSRDRWWARRRLWP